MSGAGLPGPCRPAVVRRAPGAASRVAARERARLANRMHDEVAPLLLAAQLRLLLVQEGTHDVEELRALVDRARALITEGEARIHDVVSALGDPESAADLPLRDRIDAVISALEAQFDLQVHLVVDHRVADERDGSPEAATLVVAAIREGVVNAVRHARASRVSVRVARSAPCLLAVVVENDARHGPSIGGRAVGGHGLRTLRHAVEARGGRIELVVTPGRSARLAVWIPTSAA